MRAQLAALGLLALGCRATPAAAEFEARVSTLERANTANDAAADTLELRAEQIQLAAAALIERWTDVEATMKRAAMHLEAAARDWGRASEAYARAKRDYERAERNWRVVAATLVVASMSEAGSMSLCDGQMNTAKMRRIWKRQGYDLKGIDADHIWPRSLGGANHPWNYQRMSSSLNRSLGNKLSWKLVNEPLKLLQGAATSAAIALACR